MFIDVSNKHGDLIFDSQYVREEILRIITTKLLITSRSSKHSYVPSDVRFALSE